MTGEPRQERTVVHALRRALKTHPDHPWIVTDDSVATFRDVDARSNRLAHGFLAHGVSADDTVLVMMADHPDYVAVWLALAKIGAVEVPVNVSYRGDILVHVVNDSCAKIMLAGAEFVGRLAAVRASLTHLATIVVHSGSPSSEGVNTSGWDKRRPFESLLSDTEDPPPHEPHERDLMSVMYTSGTTGPSKGVMVCHAHAYVYGDANSALLEIKQSDIFYSAGLPLFHVVGKWGIVLLAAIHCCTVVMPKQFSAKNFWSDIRRFKATKSFLLGAMANFLQRQPPDQDDRDHPLRKVIMAPLLSDLPDFIARFGVSVACGFGATEFNSPIMFLNADNAKDPSTVGKVRSDLFEVQVVDDNDEKVPPGVLGELVVRSKEPWLLTLGYWRRPEWTLDAWRNLWFHTGDAGRYDEDGTFYFVDRKKDAIRRRGENISSMEVEGIVSQHPAVQECAVFPIPSAFTEQEVMVAVVEKPGHRLDPTQLIRFVEPKMAYFMVPRYVDIVESLPKTPSGKITKVTLRERGLTPTTWDREATGFKLKR
jgi:carnitine-CoA ligase